MTNREIIPLICNYRNNDTESFEKLYKEFYGLMVHYGNKVDGEDTLQELTVFLMELLLALSVMRFEPDDSHTLQSYIAVCLRNKYIELSKKHQKRDIACEELNEQTAAVRENNDIGIMLGTALSELSKQQYNVMILKYYYDYSDAEIAQRLDISRQAVNRLKNRALTVMRNYFSDQPRFTKE